MDNQKNNGIWNCEVGKSVYHFDKNIQDKPGDYFNIMGRFEGDWSKEIRIIETPLDQFIEDKSNNDEIKFKCILASKGELHAKSKSYECFNIFDEIESKFPKLNAIANYFHLDQMSGGMPVKRLLLQSSGQMYNLHIDQLWEQSERPKDIVRITVMLEDWCPGQFFMYGNCIYQDWKAGEIHIFDWANVPHVTANASNKMRPNLQLTGLATNKTRELLAAMNKDTVISLKDLINET
jgi:hypothetical protein